uniref:Uncharacterized protein n=1 Tax=Pipistrellus kuhlii TaxID=59472 RepID=A0A7J7YWM1_PIPKU|nr:hypothetical protein mPipKuh1_009842 [Pipistrellus kuhlii]
MRPSTGTATNTLASGGGALAFPLFQVYREEERSHLCVMARSQPYYLLSAGLPISPSGLHLGLHILLHLTRTQTTLQTLCLWEMEQAVYCAALKNIVVHTEPYPPCATWTQRDRRYSSFLRGNPRPLSNQRAKKREKCPHLQPHSWVFWPEMRVEDSEPGSVATLGGSVVALGASENPPEHTVPLGTLEPKQQDGRA